MYYLIGEYFGRKRCPSITESTSLSTTIHGLSTECEPTISPRCTERSNHFGSSNRRCLGSHQSSPDFLLSTEHDVHQSSVSLDIAVDAAARRLGVAVPHSNYYRQPPIDFRNPFHDQHERSSEAPMHIPTYAPSIQCNPVSPLVLVNLPTISVVRQQDLNPEDTGKSQLDSSSTSLYTCSICCENIEIGSMAVRIPCSHLYHANCIATWLSKFNTCPICRFTLPTLVDFITAPTAKHFQSLPNQPTAQRPVKFTSKELNELSIERLHSLYKSWVICTYNTVKSRKLPIEIPTAIGDDKGALIDYLIDRQVICLDQSQKLM